jgi:hypothetical protein
VDVPTANSGKHLAKEIHNVGLTGAISYFRDQPVTAKDITDAHLIIWHFEDWLKKYFFSILQLLEVCP